VLLLGTTNDLCRFFSFRAEKKGGLTLFCAFCFFFGAQSGREMGGGRYM